MSRNNLKGNKGEWSEVYIFLKLLNDGKLYIADKNLNALKNVFLNIVKILRENYSYFTGKTVRILLNDEELAGQIPLEKIQNYKEKSWNLIQSKISGNSIVSTDEISDFFEEMKISKLRAPSSKTEDLKMEVQDYRSGINSVVGFSCKSSFSAEATLFNASNDNTNFRFKVTGNINDKVMNQFNNILTKQGHIAIGERMMFLKKSGCDLQFIKPCKETAERNLILSGGTELPEIVGSMLKFYYFENEGKSENSSCSSALNYIAAKNIAKYRYSNNYDIYERKIGTLLYDMFCGMRLSTNWDGRSSVNGGYIVVKNNGEVVAFHSTVADEFKQFLITQLGFESPSATRHNYMKIEKEDGQYFINLNLQIRFKKIKEKFFSVDENCGRLLVAEK